MSSRAVARLSSISRHISPNTHSTSSSTSTSIRSLIKMSTANGDMSPYTKKHKVAIIGSGNWGSAICKILAENTAQFPNTFEQDVRMWVYEEKCQLPKDHKSYDPSKHSEPINLTEIINTVHENIKYLPGVKLPENIVADPSLINTVKDASLLIFNIPHQFVGNICKQIEGKILPYARAVSCIKGVSVNAEGVSLFSDVIGQKLGIYCGALSGANIANEVALEKFCETTIAYSPPDSLANNLPSDLPPIDHKLWRKLFHRPYFHVRLIDDVVGVSLGGALKNIVALAAGFVEGMGWGDNAKAAVMRVGLLEMRKFGLMFFETVHSATFTEESCGVADLITSCSGGRNHRCAKLAIEQGKSVFEVEKEILNGQKLQGTLTAEEVNEFLKNKNLEHEFPLLTAVYNILQGTESVKNIPDLLQKAEDKLTP